MNKLLVKKLKRWKAELVSLRTNWQGLSVAGGPYLIIESDDWGAIRTPSRQTISQFKQQGIQLDKSVYKNDSLASASDLDALFNLLNNFKDVHDQPVKLTANVIVANPDFEAIAASNYQTYAYEKFTTTFRRYPEHNRNWEKWKEGLNSQLFYPQFHGREHLQINRWLKALQSNYKQTRYCFTHHTTYSGEADYSFMEAFDWDKPEDIEQQKSILKDGLNIFKEIFGFTAKSFIAPCYNWDSKLEPQLKDAGIEIIQSLRSQLMPTGTFDQYTPKVHHSGKYAESGLRFNIRNCFLEPSHNPNKDWIDSCLAQIKMAFKLGKPAVICSHRINYVGFINPANRDRGLRDLDQVLNTVKKHWPNVQFISTDQLISIWNNQSK